VISIDVLIGRCSGLERHVLERWIAQDWVRPDAHDGVYAFREIDVARVRLILELRDELDVSEAALPVVLLLLDQLYDWATPSPASCRRRSSEIWRRISWEVRTNRSLVGRPWVVSVPPRSVVAMRPPSRRALPRMKPSDGAISRWTPARRRRGWSRATERSRPILIVQANKSCPN
jgi:hypothetical protein